MRKDIARQYEMERFDGLPEPFLFLARCGLVLFLGVLVPFVD